MLLYKYVYIQYFAVDIEIYLYVLDSRIRWHLILSRSVVSEYSWL